MPKKIELVGNKMIQQYLQNLQKSGIVPPAQLWVGPEHIGKTTFLSQHLANLAEANVAWFSGADFDLTTARAMIATTMETSLWSGQRAIVINQAQELSYQVWNALLKVLEEPRSRVTIYLLVTALDNIPSTVQSRCQVLWFERVSDAAMIAAFPAQANMLPLAQGLPGKVKQLKKLQPSLERYRVLLQRPSAERLGDIIKADQLSEVLDQIELVLYQALPTAAALHGLTLVAQARRQSAQAVQAKFIYTNLLLNINPIL
ncbi:MAG: hypothetical protein WCV88_00270 [Patescibacteria group bacterium]